MAIHRSVRTIPFVVLTGCYMDLTAGASRTAGGVSGYGWEIGLAGGVGWDFGKTIRTSAGFDGSMARTKGSDGKFGTTGFSYHGRVDVAVSAPYVYSSAELMKRHSALAASSGGASSVEGITGQTRVVLDYGLGTNEKLHFVSPDDPMRFEERSKVHSFYVGLAREYDHNAKLQASFGIGPHVTYMPNNLVGNATAVGLQVHASYWFFPEPRKRETGSLWKHYTPSEPGKAPSGGGCYVTERCNYLGTSCSFVHVCP